MLKDSQASSKSPLHSAIGALVLAVAATFAAAQAPPSTNPARPEAPSPNPVQSPQQSPALPAPIPVKAAPAPSITILEDTLIRVITAAPIDTRHAKAGESLLFTVDEDVYAENTLAIPRGASVRGVVVSARKPGRLAGSPELTLELVSLDLGGQAYRLYTSPFTVKGASKTRATERKALEGAGAGAAFGVLTDVMADKTGVENVGAAEAKVVAVTAGVGAGVGTAVSAASPGPRVLIPAEAEISFYLASPITIKPVTAKEAARLAEGLRPGGPVLYVRGDTH